MSFPSSDSAQIPERAQHVLRTEGHVIEAIKIVREAEGIGLKEAKERVEAWIATQPVLKQQLEVRAKEARGGYWVLLLMLLAGIAAAVVYFKR